MDGKQLSLRINCKINSYKLEVSTPLALDGVLKSSSRKPITVQVKEKRLNGDRLSVEPTRVNFLRRWNLPLEAGELAVTSVYP